MPARMSKSSTKQGEARGKKDTRRRRDGTAATVKATVKEEQEEGRWSGQNWSCVSRRAQSRVLSCVPDLKSSSEMRSEIGWPAERENQLTQTGELEWSEMEWRLDWIG